MVRVSAFIPQPLSRSLNPTLPKGSARMNPRAVQAQGGSTLTLSQEAKRLLAAMKQQSKPEATEANKTHDLLATMRAAVEANAKQLAELKRAGRDPGRRIADIQQKLKQLLKRMQRAALMGDKRAAAAIAKEAAALAKELAAAVKDAAADTKDRASGAAVPTTPELFLAPASSVAQPRPEATLEAASTTPATGKEATARDPQQVSTAVGISLALTNPSPVDEGLIKEIAKAIVILRGIIAMARATIHGKNHSMESKDGNPQSQQDFRKEVDRAEAELDRATAAILADVMPPAAIPQVGFTLNLSTDG